LHLKKGIVREPHVHPNANQSDYCISGKARVGIIGPEGFKQFLDNLDLHLHKQMVQILL
jgi:oxalate decarboxylase/phosphoglucose isomerase-like protein (cupin superfamily)